MLEPLRDQPAVAMPVFGSVLGAMRGARALWIVVPLAAPGMPAAYLSGRLGIAPMVVFLALTTPVVCWGLWRSIPWKAFSELARKAPFRELSLPPEGLFADGAKVYFQLPDADSAWVEVRLPKAARLQLQAQRRVWLLGPDEKGRRFLQLPGVLWPHRVKVVPGLPVGAVRQDEVEQRIVPPEEDVVLIAHRQRIVRGIRVSFAAAVLVFVLLATVQVFAVVDDVSRAGSGIALLTLYSVVFLVWGTEAVKGMLKPLPRGKWTELVAVPHRPPQIGGTGLATLACRVQWPNGWWSDIFLSKVDPALAADIFATQRIWILGEPFRGATTFAGLPGHAVLGRVRFN
ncbi:hypothetical protein [Amycolatopsis keratiniphila]|uniref:hypothetical protein n=1 Tax=Amycolatopsis keratiniphila TaxID=129921 RepID=UPI000907AB79|nr:hypothetical protein [Amycolatopsis keratiniphila]OLZ59754.1 hypothetical protein BS330_05130 [Amycolatopsis keratiniphila subsp. nogabecina]